jgi:hypothetical protein
LIQILSIKNFGRAVPRFAAKIGCCINRLVGAKAMEKGARDHRKSGFRRRKSGQIAPRAIYRMLRLLAAGPKKQALAANASSDWR